MLSTGRRLHGAQGDTWEGQLVRIGDAVIRVADPTDRCVVITRHPETGARDLDTLRLIKGYRPMRSNHMDLGMSAA